MKFTLVDIENRIKRIEGYLKVGLPLQIIREIEEELSYSFDEDLFYLTYIAATTTKRKLNDYIS